MQTRCSLRPQRRDRKRKRQGEGQEKQQGHLSRQRGHHRREAPRGSLAEHLSLQHKAEDVRKEGSTGQEGGGGGGWRAATHLKAFVDLEELVGARPLVDHLGFQLFQDGVELKVLGAAQRRARVKVQGEQKEIAVQVGVHGRRCPDVIWSNVALL